MSAATETKQPAQVTDMENTEEARFIVPEFTVKQYVPSEACAAQIPFPPALSPPDLTHASL